MSKVKVDSDSEDENITPSPGFLKHLEDEKPIEKRRYTYGDVLEARELINRLRKDRLIAEKEYDKTVISVVDFVNSINYKKLSKLSITTYEDINNALDALIKK